MLVEIEELKGKTFTKINVEREKEDKIDFVNAVEHYKMFHEQSCCENVYIESINGDLSDLMNSPILLAEEVTEDGDDGTEYGSYTWTFYKLGTIKGSVTIRWNGESNGYYSEAVSIEKNNNLKPM